MNVLKRIYKKITSQKERKLLRRNFSPNLFINENYQRNFNTFGFVKINNAIGSNTIKKLLDVFSDLQNKPNYENTDFYINSISFKDNNLRKEIVERIYKIVTPYLSNIIIENNSCLPRNGGFCINPPNSKIGCQAHQDPTAINELETYSFTIWISLDDMNIDNGCLHLIPGSHLWGNIHRSMSIKWAFDDYTEYLQEISIPVPTKAGDIICFDNSIIHYSSRNMTNKFRLAVNIPVYPKEFEMLNYYPRNSILNLCKRADVYYINEDYFLDESFYNRPSSKFSYVNTIKLDNSYTKADINKLIQEFNTLINTNE